jgi:trimethylamine:corrinoid methyltransferase-like protein
MCEEQKMRIMSAIFGAPEVFITRMAKGKRPRMQGLPWQN